MNSPSRPAPSALKLTLCMVWLLGFGAVFYGLDFPNRSELNRSDIWSLLPDLLWSCVAQSPDASPAGWRFFPQRLPSIAIASWILAGAYGWGALSQRRLKLSMAGGEKFVFDMAIGLSALSLLMLGCGLAAQWWPVAMSRGMLSVVVTAPILWELGRAWRQWRQRAPVTGASKRRGHWSETLLRGQIPFPVLARGALLGVMGLFVMAMALGAALPQTDFDVKEYHLGGPKEWFQTGSIHFLPHNVYTSFPFLTEMFLLLGMVLRGDWFEGALAGQLVLGMLGPLTACVVFLMGRRWFSSEVGWTAALIHLTTPWTYRISIIAYAEGGATFFLIMAVYAAAVWFERRRETDATSWLTCLGICAGSGMACKYPGLLSVVGPAGLFVVGASWASVPAQRWRRVLINVAIYGLGVCLAVGPWLVKNLCETGNPVYPLLHRVFGGVDWTPTLEANWKKAHGPSDHQPLDILVKLFDVSFKSDWLSPLLFSLAPLALLNLSRRSDEQPQVVSRGHLVLWLWAFVSFLFGSWWVCTHRIDRFWIPMIPVVALLAGAGAWWSTQRLWRWIALVWIGTGVLFNLGFIVTPHAGLNAYLSDLGEVARQVQSTAPGVKWLNEHLPPNSKVLMVGEAQIFDARFPLVYHTVFDQSIFEQWCSAQMAGTSSQDQPLRPATEIRERLREEGITHVFVNWGEIWRYRDSGYGYSDFVTPRRFVDLQRAGVLTRDMLPITGLRPADSFSPPELVRLEAWAPELLVQTPQGRGFVLSQLFVIAH